VTLPAPVVVKVALHVLLAKRQLPEPIDPVPPLCEKLIFSPSVEPVADTVAVHTAFDPTAKDGGTHETVVVVG